MKTFVDQQRELFPLSDKAIESLLVEMEEVEFLKGTFSIREGEREPYLWFVKTGFVRSFIERDAKDITLWFASDGEMINFVYRDIAAYNLEMMEDSVLLKISNRKFEELCDHSLELSNWFRKLLLFYLNEYENYFINDSWSDAREQYESLMRERPELFQKVPLKHIASFLQITPQSLSRIRSNIR